MRVANAIWALVFVFAAAVQYNSPDGVYWSVLYVSAAFTCAYGATGRRSWVLPAMVGAGAVAWAAALASQTWGRVRVTQLFGAWEMSNVAIERGREIGGLLIVAGWMLLMVIDGLRRRSASRSVP